MKREYRLFIDDMLDCIIKIEQFVGEMSFDELVADEKTNNAVVRKLEIIGEATKNIPKFIKEKYPALPWSEMAKIRDKIIHDYFGLNFQIIWQVIKDKLPELKIQIKTILDDLQSDR